MERNKLAGLGWAVVAVGIGLFSLAITGRTIVNPWWSNAAVAVLVLVATQLVLGKSLARLFQVRLTALAAAVALAAVMVAATHVCFGIATDLIPGLGEQVSALYLDIDRQSPGRAVSLLLIIVVVVAEELLWRGIVVELCSARLGRFFTGVVSIALYAVPQVIGGNWVLVAAAVVVGAVFVIQRLATKGLAAPITTHAIWSACIFSLIPLS